MTIEIKRVLKAEKEHDYNQTYKKGVTVYNIVDNNIKAYISLKEVPRFISILDTRFWREIASDEDDNNIPSINGIALIGNKTGEDLGLMNNYHGSTEERIALKGNVPIGTLFYDSDLKKYFYYGIIDSDIVDWIQINTSLEEYDARHTKYTIDQSISYENNTPIYKLPEDMIINHIPSKDNNDKIVINSKLVYSDAIRRIRENTYLYVGRYNNDTNILEAKQISDTDKTMFANGTQIVLEDEDDIFMKLPKFWWKSEYNKDETCIITFATEEEDIDSSYKCWEGNVFIGVYEGIIINRGTEENPINKLYSKSGVTPTVNQSWTIFTNAARSRGSNYTLVDYETHCMMAMLGYGWLGTTDSQSIIGKGTSSYPKITGLCDNKGMTDSSISVDGNSTSINFWGLENWWGDISEWIDNLKTAGNYKVNILDTDLTTIKRVVETNLQENDSEIKQMVLGTNFDLIPKLIVTNSNYNRGYADGGYVYAGSGYVVSRSGAAASLSGGLGCLSLNAYVSRAFAYIGSRLLYRGNYEIVDNFVDNSI